jgi:serine/threonine-protein kinase ATR
MAGTAQRRSRNADLGNGSLLKTAEPASSILDAHHLSEEAHGTISQLRKELIERAPGTAFPRSGESIKHTLSLICVALRVASDDVPPTGDIPPGSDTEQHLSNCLDIVQLLVENAPRALLDELEPELLGLDVPFPFYAWLTTLLVELSAKVRLANVEGKISGLLALMALSQHNMSRSSSLRHSLSTMFRVIVTGRLEQCIIFSIKRSLR